MAALTRLVKAAEEQFVVKEAAAVSHVGFACFMLCSLWQVAGADLAAGFAFVLPAWKIAIFEKELIKRLAK